MSNFWDHEEWAEPYFADPYFPGQNAKGQPGSYWNGRFWANEYWSNQYWFDTGTHELDFMVVRPAKVGGDDVPYYDKNKHRGWNKKAWLKQQKLEAALLKTLQDKANPPKKRKKPAPDYGALLTQLQAIDDEEAAMLLL